MRLVLLALVASLALALAGGAAAFTGPGVVSALNALRAGYGLPPLAVAPYDQVGADSWPVEQDSSTTTPLDAITGWPEFDALALDPRARAVGTSPGKKGTVWVAFDLDSSLPLARAVLPRRVDPGSPVGLTVLLPAPGEPVRLFEMRGNGEVRLPVKPSTARGPGGTQLVEVDAPGDADLQLGYGRRYRLELGERAFSFWTSQVPASYLAKTWRFAPSMTPAARAAYLGAFAGAPALARRIAAQLDGAILVRRAFCGEPGTSCADSHEDGSYSISITPADFADPPSARFVSLHEFGHMVDYFGLDDAGYKAFRDLFRNSPAWRRCFPDDTSDTGCVELAEIFADQFAYWATGFTDDPAGGYGDPPLASRADFGRVLAEQYAFRPPFWRNPAVAHG